MIKRFVQCGVLIASVHTLTAAEPADYSQGARPVASWEIVFGDDISVDEYARQLDYFGIELGVVNKAGQVQYASHFADKRPQRRTGDRELDKRLCVTWKWGTLATADRKLLTKAGINAQDRELLHFYPTSIAADMAKLERTFANHDLADIKLTRFKLQHRKGAESGYELVVLEQKYKSMPEEPAGLKQGL